MCINGSLVTAILILSVLSLGGCAKDRRLAPPPDSEKVKITVKVPDKLQARKIQVIYRSKTCQRLRGNGNGEYVEVQGYNHMEIEPKRRGDTDLYDAYVPMDGGGACNWQLSSAKFGVFHSGPLNFGDNTVFDFGGGAEIYFDPATSMMGYPGKQTDGDVVILADYYPWLNEVFLGGHKKSIRLFNTKYGKISYLAPQARNIYFEPILHADYLVSSVQADVKDKKDLTTTFTYPDGTVSVERRSFPDFNRLQAIRLKLEAYK